MESRTCPSRDELSALYSGRLDEQELSRIETHINDCSTCQEFLKTAPEPPDDPVLAGLREQPRPLAFASESACRDSLASLESLISGEVPSLEATVIGLSGDSAEPGSQETELETIREYQLLEKIGEGGMGAVYKARHLRLGKIVALKRLPSDRVQNEPAVARFEREMKAIGQLDHPNIVRALDAGEHDGTHFLVMEFVQGIDLGQLSRKLGPLRVADACELVRQAALGLQEAHEHGMVHRDIKPSNLILAKPARRAEPPVVKILDLGLALLGGEDSPTEGELTATGLVMGTIDYMSPEQCRDTHNVDIRADIYALGATLYKLLTGDHPLANHKDRSVLSKLVALASEPPAPIGNYRSDIPEELIALVERLLAKVPGDRPQTPQQVADLLAPFCRDADLAALLEQAQGDVTATPHGRETRSLLKSASAETSPWKSQAAGGASAPALGAAAGKRKPPGMRLLCAGGVGALLVLGAVIYIATDRGQVTIEAPDDLVENVSVSIMRNGAAAVEGWLIEPGKNEHRIRTGSVAVKLPAEVEDSFELQPPGDLILRRGRDVAYRLVRRASAPGSADQPEAPSTVPHSTGAAGRHGLDFNVDLTGTPLKGSPRIELPEPVRLDGPLTVEMYLTLHDVERNKNQLLFGAASDFKLCIWKHELKWSSGKQPPGEKPYAYGSKVLAAGVRRHLALASDGKTARLFLDGRLVGEGSMPPAAPEREDEKRDTFIGGFDWGTERDWVPLNGVIDEIRVSTVSRYQQPFTPPHRLTADADTYLLYDLSEGAGETANDSSGHGRHGKIVGAKWVRAGEPVSSRATRSALDFSVKLQPGSARVELPPFLDVSQPFTIEMYAHPRSIPQGWRNRHLFHASGPLFLKQTGSNLEFGTDRRSDQEFVRVRTPLNPGARLHVAGVSTGREFRLFVNGRFVGSAPGSVDLRPDAPRYCILGGETKDLEEWEPFDGTMDQVRISKSARYSQDFSPPAELNADADTLALYRFDEGTGNTLSDSSGNGQHGKIIGAKWVRVEGAASSSPSAASAQAVAPPVPIDEPPPLKEWLQGRTILTVAQDGSGQYKTIQQALSALKPGQAVQVLDRGPYRERLDVSPPPETALFSLVGTVLELSEWLDEPHSDGNVWKVGHVLHVTGGFRVSGLDLVIREPYHYQNIGFSAPSPNAFTLESCRVSRDCAVWVGGVYGSGTPASDDAPNFVRDCLVDGVCNFSGGHGAPTSIVVLRNFFDFENPTPEKWVRHVQAYAAGTWGFKSLVFRRNVFGAGANCGLLLNIANAQHCEISNNTFLSQSAIILKTLPRSPLIVRNNLHAANGILSLEPFDPVENQDEVTRTWQVTHNAYSREAARKGFPRAVTDTVAAIQFVSMEPTHPAYARLPKSDPLGASGAGGAWPDFVGAFPSGPAAPTGDWFTQLRERWMQPSPPTATAPPINVDEPPTLDEWLTGRSVLTVAQDGSGDYKTIQAALNAVKSGQVVKVLDKGPYRESLRMIDPPSDIGLVSEAQTVLELTGWDVHQPGNFPYRRGHRFHNARDFRLSGFAFSATTDGTQHPHQHVVFQTSSGVVVEDCRFSYADAEKRVHFSMDGLAFSGFGVDVNRLTVVQNCVVEGKLHVTCYRQAIAAPLLFTRNILHPWPGASGAFLQGWVRKAYIRQNVILAEPPSMGIQFLINPDNTTFESLVISNNTVLGTGSNMFQLWTPEGEVTIQDNVLTPFRLADGAETNAAAVEAWRLANNWYVVRPESFVDTTPTVYRRPNDPQVDPQFLSENPLDPNFARLKAVTAVPQAGALPPGPAPAEGDWFTQLRDRWLLDASPSQPEVSD